MGICRWSLPYLDGDRERRRVEDRLAKWRATRLLQSVSMTLEVSPVEGQRGRPCIRRVIEQRFVLAGPGGGHRGGAGGRLLPA